MPFILENIDRYIIYVKNNALYIEDKLIHPNERKALGLDDDDREKKRRV